jgi:glycosyltransferase involved in cell wall biosynthesis
MNDVSEIQVSLVIVTHNPAAELLSAALDSIERQDFPLPNFEVIVVDNASCPPLDDARLNERHFDIRIVREPRLGIVHARCAGVQAASGSLIVFVDDDNQIACDYLDQSVRIAQENPTIGAFGGICKPHFEGPMAKWKAALLPYLGVRDHGPDAITSNSGEWGKWDPIGAGMVVRNAVGRRFVEFVENHEAARRLGRTGKSLMSGEDTLMARVAWMMNYACSYQPSLRSSHYMKLSRLAVGVLVRTLLGHGRSYVILQRILGRPAGRITPLTPIALLSSYFFRVRSAGIRAGSIIWFWDLGRILELLDGAKPAVECEPAR